MQKGRLTRVAQDAETPMQPQYVHPSKGKIPMQIFNTKIVLTLALGILTIVGVPTIAATEDGNTLPPAANAAANRQENRQERRMEKRNNAKAHGQAKARGGINRLVRQFNLSREQKQQLRPIVKQSREQSRTIRQNTTLPREEKRAQLLQLRRSTQEQIAKILTPEQNRQLEELLQQKREEQRQNRSKRRSQRSYPNMTDM
jgi:Spy/CpxP family protein refolding chaperone